MPEGPEYQKMKQFLEHRWTHRRIEAIEPLREQDKKFTRGISWQAFCTVVIGREITSVTCRGKNLLVGMGPITWRVHFGSTGWFMLSGRQESNPIEEHFLHSVEEKTTRVLFGMDDGRVYHYRDARTWGQFHIHQTDDLDKWESQYGPDWLTDRQSSMVALLELSSRRKVKDILTDQKIAAGIGNYLSCEAMFLAGVDPSTRWSDLSRERKNKLLLATAQVVREAIASDSHQHWRVFKRAGDPCVKCGTPILYQKDSAAGQRGSYFCGECQSP